MDKRLTLIRFWMVFGFVALAAGNVRSEEDESDECSGTDGGGTSRIQVAQSSETREECIRKVINYWTRVLIPNDIKLFVTEARQYYDQPEAVDGDYEVPERPKSCKTLKKALSCQLKRAVPCWNNPRITGHISKHEALLDLMKTEDMREAERRYIKALHENNYACKHGRNSGKAMRDDGVFSLFENWQNEQEIPNVSREQCMEQVTKYWESLLSVVTPDIEDRVEEARQYYGHTERLPGYLEPLETETCRVLTDAMEERERKIPCWSYAHITGDWRQAMKEVLSKSIDTRAGMEAVYACDFGLNAGPMLRERQFFDAVVDWQFAHVKSRDECLQQFANYWDSQEPLADDIKARVARASKYYDEVERIFGYVRPLPTESCVKLDDKMYYESGKAVPCWKSVLVMGDDTTQDWIDACKASIALRKAKEAEYACDHGDNAGLVMKEHGLFGAVVLGEYDESDSDEGQSLSDNEEENYSDSDE